MGSPSRTSAWRSRRQRSTSTWTGRRSTPRHPPFGRIACGAIYSLQHDLYPAALWLAHAVASRHQQMRIAEALDGDRVRRYAVLNQLRLHRRSAADRQAHIVAWRPRGIGVAIHLDARVLHLGRIVRRFPDDLARTIGQRRLVPIEEHEIGAGHCGDRHGGGAGGGAGWPKVYRSPKSPLTPLRRVMLHATAKLISSVEAQIGIDLDRRASGKLRPCRGFQQRHPNN